MSEGVDDSVASSETVQTSCQQSNRKGTRPHERNEEQGQEVEVKIDLASRSQNDDTK